MRRRNLLPGVGLALLLAACTPPGQEGPPPPPSAELVAEGGYWSLGGEAPAIEITGNVARLTLSVDPAPFERGGDLWAKAMPYLLLFSSGTRQALADHPGLGGVRVVILHPSGEPSAQALLSRGTLTERDWNRALQIAAAARTEATERPGRMRDLVQWGEDHTEFEYNSRYIGGVP